MPEISISEQQHEQLEQVRADVEDAFVENYGYIPLEDALQYLLDTYTPPEERESAETYERLAAAEYPQLQAVASEVPDVPGSGIDAEEMRGRLLAELGAEEFATKLRRVADDPGPTDDERSNATGPDTVDGQSPELSTEEGVAGAPAGEGSGTDTGAGSSSGSVSTDVSGGADPLAAVNRLLDQHSNRWREGSGDEPYEVDLPDGRTESVRTKDDVRRLLRRHY